MSKLKRAFTIIMCILLTLPMCLVSKPNNVHASNETVLTQNVQYLISDYEYISMYARATNTGTTASDGCVGASWVEATVVLVGVTADRATTTTLCTSTRRNHVSGGSNTTGESTTSKNYYFTDNDRKTYKYFYVYNDSAGSNAIGVNCAHDYRYEVGNIFSSSASFKGVGFPNPVFSGDLASGNLMSVEYIHHLSTYSGCIDKP